MNVGTYRSVVQAGKVMVIEQTVFDATDGCKERIMTDYLNSFCDTFSSFKTRH